MRKFSVIMPCHDAGRFLASAVASVLGQEDGRRVELELIIVDDASRDAITLDTLRAVAKDARVRILKSRSCLGAAGARNMALGHATGDYVAFLDADDIWMPNHLDLHLTLRMESSATLTSTDYDLVDESGQIVTPGVMMVSPQKGPPPTEGSGRSDSAHRGQTSPVVCRSVSSVDGVRGRGSWRPDRGGPVRLPAPVRGGCRPLDAAVGARRFAFAPEVTAQHRQNRKSLVSTARSGVVDLALAEVYADLRKRKEFRDLSAPLREAAAANYLSAAHGFRRSGTRADAARCAWRGTQQEPFRHRGYKGLIAALAMRAIRMTPAA